MSRVVTGSRRWTVVLLIYAVVASGAATAQLPVVEIGAGQLGEVPGLAEKIQRLAIDILEDEEFGDYFFATFYEELAIGGPFEALRYLFDELNYEDDDRGSATESFQFARPHGPELARFSSPVLQDAVVTAYARDGGTGGSQTIVVRAVKPADVLPALSPLTIDDVPSFSDILFSKVALAEAGEGRAAVFYTSLITTGQGTAPAVFGQQIGTTTFDLIGSPFQVTDQPHADVAAAALTSNDVLVVSAPLNGATITPVIGQLVDFSGATPSVGAEFSVSTTAGLLNQLPTVAAHQANGRALVVWENLSLVGGDPSNVRGRFVDANGSTGSADFLVNETMVGSQAQPAVAMDPRTGISVVVWAGDGLLLSDELDVYGRIYDADGSPIGSEFLVNTGARAGFQDRPDVQFFASPDGDGRPRFLVGFRDVGQLDGGLPNGSGTSFRVFAVPGVEAPFEIFADGFESGDVSKW